MTAVLPASPDTHVIPIADESRIGDARRRIVQLGESLGYDETCRGKLAIIVTELATNLHLHARGGYLLVRTHGLADGIEVMAVDRGAGMTSIQDCLRDGYSTAGTAGNGLGAIRRLSHTFDIYSQPGIGTVVLAQLYRTGPKEAVRFVVGGVTIALNGELACGDAWSFSPRTRGARLALADGLGHGIDAAQASLRAIRTAETAPGLPIAEVIQKAHGAIASTRGAAMSICDLDCDTGTARFVGIGNVAGVIVNGAGQQRSMVSHNGIVGHQLLKVQEFQYPWSRDSLLVMHSDGLVSRWSFDDAPGLGRRHPSIVAAVLHRDFARERDDACVVVLREAL